jgi:2-polyprenyl-6-methoxyphenol hydroxylase-like FAD-dependent oxidoreductase
MIAALVIGGGIGGLATAIALQRHGIEAHVFEATPALEAAGAGILMPPNAMWVLTRLGLGEAVDAAGTALERLEVRDLRAGLLQAFDAADLRARVGHVTVAIRRSELQRILAGALAPGTLHLGCRLIRYEDEGTEVCAHFADGRRANGRLLIGADGIHSAVRNALRPARLRYSGQTCFRGLAPHALPDTQSRTACELWGGSARFGYATVGPGCVYGYAPFTAPAGETFDARSLVPRYAAFPPEVRGLIAATPTAAVLQTDLYDLAPTRGWSAGNVVLLGDAAHAATPNLGQGGAQALEDALALATRLASAQPVAAAFGDYERARWPRVRSVVTRSWYLGKIAHWERPAMQRLRNRLLQSTPARLQQRQADDLFTARL